MNVTRQQREERQRNLEATMATSGVLPRYSGHLRSILDRSENIDQLPDVLRSVKATTPQWFQR